MHYTYFPFLSSSSPVKASVMSTIEKFYWEMTIFHTRLQPRYIKEKRETGKACFFLEEEFVINLSSHLPANNSSFLVQWDALA